MCPRRLRTTVVLVTDEEDLMYSHLTPAVAEHRTADDIRRAARHSGGRDSRQSGAARGRTRRLPWVRPARTARA